MIMQRFLPFQLVPGQKICPNLAITMRPRYGLLVNVALKPVVNVFYMKDFKPCL